MSNLLARQRPSAVVAITGSILLLGAAASALWSTNSTAQVANVAAAAGAARVEFADLIEQVSPAVVNIAVEKTVRPANFNGQNPFSGTPFEHFFGPGGRPGHPQQRAGGVGSGFIIDADGYIVTNHHVVEGASEVTVTLVDGEQYTASVVGADAKTDLALLQIEPNGGLPYVPFGDSDDARVGEWVVAIGNPFGLGGTATAGIISARGRDINSGPYDDYLQIDAPVNRGNSGGPVFNTDGQVIGVNTAIYSPNGGSVGIGFAIPSSQVTSVIEDLREHGQVKRGWLGVEIQKVTGEIANSLALEQARGALVAAVSQDSPADAAGVRIGDVIVKYNGKDVADPKALSRAVADTQAGEKTRLDVWRDGQSKSLSVRIAPREDEILADNGTGGSNDPTLGLRLSKLDREARARFQIAPDIDGVVVTAVKPGSAAAARGIRAGDVISMLNQRKISSLSDLQAVLKGAKQSDRESVLALVQRGDSRRFVTLGMG